MRALCADHVVDRTADLAAQVKAIAPGGVDAALHLAGDPFAVADLLAAGGRFASLLGVGGERLAGRMLTATAVIADPRREVLDGLAAAVAADELTVPVQQVYPLEDVPRAFGDFAAGTVGKLAVTIG